MLVYLEDKKKEFEGKTVQDLLEDMDINPVTVVTKVNGKIKTEDEELKQGDKVELVSVVSGG